MYPTILLLVQPTWDESVARGLPWRLFQVGSFRLIRSNCSQRTNLWNVSQKTDFGLLHNVGQKKRGGKKKQTLMTVDCESGKFFLSFGGWKVAGEGGFN